MTVYTKVEELVQRIWSFCREHTYAVSTVVVLLLMLSTSYISWNWYDVQWWLIWHEVASSSGILHIYDMTPKNAYPPLLPLTFIALYDLGLKLAHVLGVRGLCREHPDPSHYLGVNIYVPPIGVIDIARFVTKLPTLVSILLIGYVLYKKFGQQAAVMWYMSIPVWTVLWGSSPDPVIALLVLLHVLYLSDKPFTSGVLLGVASMFKPAPLILVPAAILYLRGLSARIRLILGVAVVTVAVCLPFLIASPQAFIHHVVLFHQMRYAQELSLWNIPQVITWYHVLIPEFRFAWEYIFLLLYTLVLILARRLAMPYMVTACLIFLVFYLSNKIGNTPYLVWSLPLIVVVLLRVVRGGHVKVLLWLITATAFILYPGLLYFPAAALHEKIFIVEDLRWWDAYYLYVMSFYGLAYDLACMLLNFAQTHLRGLMLFLYTHFNVLAALVILLYNSLLAYLFARIVHAYARNKTTAHPSLVLPS